MNVYSFEENDRFVRTCFRGSDEFVDGWILHGEKNIANRCFSHDWEYFRIDSRISNEETKRKKRKQRPRSGQMNRHWIEVAREDICRLFIHRKDSNKREDARNVRIDFQRTVQALEFTGGATGGVVVDERTDVAAMDFLRCGVGSY